jgi:hypothetical protein
VKSSISFLLGFALQTLAPTSQAAPPAPAAAAPVPAPNWYNVEVIVFRNLDPKAGALETWPVDPGEPDWKSAVPLATPDSVGPPVPFQTLSPVNEQLDEDWNRLKRSHTYQPLLHITWTQPATDRVTSSAVRIGVPVYAVPAAATVIAPSATPAPVPAPARVAAPGGTSMPPPLVATPVYGSAKLSTTGNYLHFDLDLAFRGSPLSVTLPVVATGAHPAAVPGVQSNAVPAPPGVTGAAAAAFQLYRLSQDRRIDAGKLSYFDHPLFGALVLVTPVRKP